MQWELFMFKHLHISVANGKSWLFKNGIHLQHQIDWNLAVLFPTQRNFYKIQIRIGGHMTAHLHYCGYLIRGDAFLAMRCHSANSLPEWVDTTNDRIPHMKSYITWLLCNMIIMLTVNQLLRFYEVTRHSTFCENKVASMTYP